MRKYQRSMELAQLYILIRRRLKQVDFKNLRAINSESRGNRILRAFCALLNGLEHIFSLDKLFTCKLCLQLSMQPG